MLDPLELNLNRRWIRLVLSLCSLAVGLALLLLMDFPQDSSETVTMTEQAAASDSNCPNRINPITGRCRSCADRTHFRSNGECVQKTMNHPGDPPCSEGMVYYSTYGCREVECPLGPPHGDAVRDSNGNCLRGTPPGVPRNVSVTAGVGSLTVKWAQPSSSGSSTISAWDIHYSYQETTGAVTSTRNKARRITDGGIPTDGVTLTGLEYGITYQVRVRAENSWGSGSYSSPIPIRTTVPAVTLVGLEVTQGLQDWEGNIDLVKGKRTVVRVFLEPWGGQTTAKPVTVRLRAFRRTIQGEVQIGTAIPVNRIEGRPSDPDYGKFRVKPNAANRRDELDASANFLLEDSLAGRNLFTGPYSHWVGNRNITGRYPVSYRLEVDEGVHCEEAIDPDNTCQANLSYRYVKQPQIRVVGIETTDQSLDKPTRELLEEQALRIESMMPISELDYDLRIWETVIDPSSGQNGLVGILKNLLVTRANENSTSVYLGVIFGSGGGGRAEDFLSNAAVWYTGRVDQIDSRGSARNRGSHEFGHVIGEYHAAYSDPSDPHSNKMWTICSDSKSPKLAGYKDDGDDDDEEHDDVKEYPFRDSSGRATLGPTGHIDTEIWGLDTRLIRGYDDAIAIMDPEKVFSVMSYCYPNNGTQERWIDKFHHPRFIKRINDIDWQSGPDDSSDGNPPSQVDIYTGYVTRAADGVGGASGSSGVALPVMRISRTLPSRSGNYMLEFLDASRNVLKSVSFGTYTIRSESDDQESELWVVPVSDPPTDWAKYRISKTVTTSSGVGGAEGSSSSTTVLTEVTRSANAPTVSVTAPTAGQILNGDTVTFSWSGTDADSDTLSYMVEYSDDGGSTYETIAVDHTSSSMTTDRIRLAGSTSARIRVTVSDGTRSTSVQSPIFTVAANSPEVFIHSPADNSSLLGARSLILRATAYDPEDGRLGLSSIRWSSSIDGALGTGGSLVTSTADLTAGVHVLTATATDSSGASGSASVTWSGGIKVPLPAAPGGLKASGGSGSVDLSWNNPANATITGYRYRTKTGTSGYGNWQTITGAGAATTSHTITGLTATGAGYDIELQAGNGSGWGAAARTSATTGPANSPTGVTAAPGNASIALSWDSPPSGYGITMHRYRYEVTDSGSWTSWTELSAATTTATITGLTNGTSYRIGLAAKTSAGWSATVHASATPLDATPTTAPTTPAPKAAAPPGAPGGLKASGGHGSVDLSWTDPADNTITGYRYRTKTGSGGYGSWQTITGAGASTVSHTITGLTATGTGYDIELQAGNSAGWSTAARASATTGLAQSPTGVAATPRNNSVVLSWDAPPARYGILRYQHRHKKTSSSSWSSWTRTSASATDATITGLTNGTGYDIELAAVGILGASAPIRTAATPVLTAPAAPTGLTATPAAGSITLTWNNPGDTTITGYRYRERPSYDSNWWCWSGIWASGATTTSFTVPKLVAGTTHRIQLQAINAAGPGPAAEISAATTAAATTGTAPAAPTGLTSTAGNQSIAMSWTNPADNTITRYQFRERSDYSTDWHCWRHLYNSTAATTSHTVPGITNNVRYRVQLRAHNPHGAGPTAETSATPTPPAPASP